MLNKASEINSLGLCGIIFQVKKTSLNDFQPNHSNRANWLKNPMQSGKYHHWLIDKGSLTARLKKKYADFLVQPVQVMSAKAFLDEASLLKMPVRQKALIREVMLMGNQQALVFAHSVLPASSLRGPWAGLRRLGSQPLGASLFANPQVKRTPLTYKKLSPQHLLYQHATQTMQVKPLYLWARRSVFSLHDARIMVTEVFLPQLLSVIKV